jgi:hypothetical protein
MKLEIAALSTLLVVKIAHPASIASNDTRRVTQ